jgi:predicted unusual protein kinase regulating ubiquinone biosynthesis (AarF/ABC1/UbiB family)
MAERRPPTSRLGRSARIGALVAGQSARAAGGGLADRARTDDDRRRAAQSRRYAKIAEEVVDQLGRMKGAAMKFGQVLSTVDLPNLEPEDRERLKAKLAALRDDAPRVAFRDMEKVMRQEWGEAPSRVLADIDEDAAAAASIGQVYRATTREGAEVAVKVQYPGIAEAVDADLRAARALVPLVKRLSPGLNGKALVHELRERISEELDYDLEAQNGRRVARAWRDHPHLHVPAVDTALSTRRVLVTEWVDGDGFAQMKAEDDATRDRLGETAFRFFFATAKEQGLALGDPHPGNLLHGRDGRLVALDFGLARTLPAGYYARENAIYRALTEQDAPGLRRVLDDLGYLTRPVDEDLMLRYFLLTGEWMWAHEQPFRLSGDYAIAMARAAMDLGPEWLGLVRSFDIPPEALLLRRMENLLFSLLCDLRAAADWNALGEELRAGLEPRTPLGLEHAAWREARGARAAA